MAIWPPLDIDAPGAAAKDLQAALSGAIKIVAPAHAIGDGVADDTAEVLSAWSEASAGQGGVYFAPSGFLKTPGSFPISENWVEPTFMRFTKATRLALFDGSPAAPNEVDDDPVLWTQKHTRYDNGTDQNAHAPGVVHDVIVYGNGLPGATDIDGTWIGGLGNAVMLGQNLGSDVAADYDARGNLIGWAGFARSQKPAGISAGLWGYASTPEMSQTEFDNYAGATSFPTVGIEVNIDVRTPDAGYKTLFGGKGITAGYLGYNFRPAGQGVRDWSFGMIFSGSADDGNFSSTDIDNWNGFYVGTRYDFIKKHGIEFGGYFKDGSYGIKFPDTYAGSQRPAAAIYLGNNKINMGQYAGSDWSDNDIWQNGGQIFFRRSAVNERILTERSGFITVTKTGSALEQQLRTVHSVSPALTLQRANNSSGLPAAVANGDRLAAFFLGGFDGAGYGNGATIESYASEDWTASAHGQSLIFSTTAEGSTTRATRLEVGSKGNIWLGTGALATTATDGFLHLAASAGAPTGVPTIRSGRVPIHIDSTNSRIYAYIGGAWKSVTLT